jgi:hypothetical protein
MNSKLISAHQCIFSPAVVQGLSSASSASTVMKVGPPVGRKKKVNVAAMDPSGNMDKEPGANDVSLNLELPTTAPSTGKKRKADDSSVKG